MMKIDLECDCGADMHIIVRGGADEATVHSVATWIRMHSLHGVKLVKKEAETKDKKSDKTKDKNDK